MRAATIPTTNRAKVAKEPTASGRLLLLVPTTSYRIGDFLQAAERLGVDVAVGSDQHSVLAQFSPGRTMTVDLMDLARGVSQIAGYHRDYPLAAIIGVDQETTLLAAKAGEALELRHNAPASVEATGNKYRFRNRLANSGLPAPWFTLLDLADDPGGQARNMPYPVVLKPLALSASRGVIRANDPQQFLAARKRIEAILAGSGQRGEAASHILVEAYIPGQEVALEGLLDAGELKVLALFDKPDPLEGPFFEETIYITPSRLPTGIQSDIAATVANGVATLGLRHGPIHAELRINAQGAWLIEVAARSIGGLCARALDFGGAGRLEDLIIRHALGIPATDGAAQTASGVMMIPIPCAGVLRQVDGLEAAAAVPGIQDITISIPLGDSLVPVPEGNRYLGFIFSNGATPDAVEAALRQAHGLLQFEIEAA
ncbi:MAG: ATP-grasp domain-containing protein [Rhodospirillaceae bacterium]|nr:ATP-grasp domain-containing protein [Rhodospirillaceae bacterium]MBT3493465.1 ATP-grasp domain-containing protein [Rhodospirillaceae bacterium]MBT3778979.1 ATP-grasp domain-containing protein [Rhodospirillaceae bacterium]MBT3976804.1 ATP-grasp domain-containing protein [Rhodospirillaceae bacterium]MBT4167165.1 ATP-grasp domain-containing protein [Rhodospirillaceae bacterium]